MYCVRMTISIFLGVISVFLLLWAIELHIATNNAYRRAKSSNESDSGATEYHQAMLGPICFRYGLSGAFLALSCVIFAFDNLPNRDAMGGIRVDGVEEK